MNEECVSVMPSESATSKEGARIIHDIHLVNYRGEQNALHVEMMLFLFTYKEWRETGRENMIYAKLASQVPTFSQCLGVLFFSRRQSHDIQTIFSALGPSFVYTKHKMQNVWTRTYV